MDDMQLSWYQALQLLALGPCLFMIFFLCVAAKNKSQIGVPVLYFVALSCSFILPLRDFFGFGQQAHTLLLMGANIAAPASFLFIVQCITGRVPKPVYWTVLAIPLVGGGQLAYATAMTDGEVCIYEHLCTTPIMFRKLYGIFSISLICLLALLMYSRMDKSTFKAAPWRSREKYALVMALLVLNLGLLVIDFAQISGHTDQVHARVAKMVVRIGFIYLALTLLFRIFDRPVEIAYDRVPLIKPPSPSPKDLELAAQIRNFFATEKLHRDMNLSRAKLARKMAVTEATLSRIVNVCFQENVSMLINHYRVEEAKERLATDSAPITTIAFEVGFSSIPSFNRVFKQFSTMSPSEYRQAKKSV